MNSSEEILSSFVSGEIDAEAMHASVQEQSDPLSNQALRLYTEWENNTESEDELRSRVRPLLDD